MLKRAIAFLKSFSKAETISLFAVCVAVLSSILTIYISISQAELARKSYEYTRDLTEKQLTAYVDIAAASLTQYNVGEKPYLQTTFKNNGRTPALNVKVDVQFQLLKKGENYSFNANYNGGLARKFLSSDAIFTNHMITEKSISKDDKESFDKGEVALMFFVSLHYDDVFGKSRPFFQCLIKRHDTTLTSETLDSCDF